MGHGKYSLEKWDFIPILGKHLYSNNTKNASGAVIHTLWSSCVKVLIGLQKCMACVLTLQWAVGAMRVTISLVFSDTISVIQGEFQ